MQADPDRLVQILLNLLSNASKYTGEGGRVTVQAEADDGVVWVHVRDTGVGLTEEERGELFTRFYRSSSEGARRAGGTGLGLVITKALVELHGGEIRVESSAGQGSTFSFSLPVRQPGRASARPITEPTTH